MIFIDASGHTLGRIAGYAAKKALMGEDVVVVNAETIKVSGSKENILKENLDKLDIRNKGNYREGPFHYKRPDRYVRKAIRGMLPYKKSRGREAYKRIIVYIGVPEKELKDKHKIDVKKTKPENLDGLKRSHPKHLTVEQICKSIGGSW